MGHVGFWAMQVIQDFNKIARPLCKLLVKETLFIFDEECKQAFEALKKILTSTPVIRHPTGVYLLRLCAARQIM